MNKKLNTYRGMFVAVAVGALAMWMAGACMNALIFTGEIGFGRANRMANISTSPGEFWFAFWFQMLLAGGALAFCWHDFFKHLRALRVESGGHGEDHSHGK